MKCLHLFCLLLFSPLVFSQQYDGAKGYTSYQKYDKSYITPTLRSKHSISLGIQNGWTTPMDSTQQNLGFHIGYNYLIVSNRPRKLSIKKKTIDEFNWALGSHFSYFKNGEWMINANVYRPLIHLRGTMLSAFLFNELSFGIHNAVEAPIVFDDSVEKRPISLTYGLEVLRIRFGRAFILHGGATWSFQNDLLNNNPMVVSILFGARYYIYKRK